MHTLLFSLLSFPILLFLSHLYIRSARTHPEPISPAGGMARNLEDEDEDEKCEGPHAGTVDICK